MPRKVIVFDDFTKGEYGTLQPVEYGERGKTGLWTGTNMAILPDGSLCPQPMPKAQATTLPALAGSVVDIGMGQSLGSRLWFKAGNKIYQSGAGPTFTFTALTGTSADAVSYVARTASGTTTFAITSGSVVEMIDHTAGSVAAVAGVPATTNTICQFNDRMMLGSANRLYFSAAGNFASWPAANYIDVGDSSPIVALTAMRGFLLITKSGGSDDTWWVLRGTPGVNAALRRAGRFQVPARANGIEVLNDGRVGFGATVAAVGDTGSIVPAGFDGASGTTRVEQLGWLSDALTTEAYRMVNSNDMMLKNNLLGMMRRNGAWSRFTIPSAVQPNVSNFSAFSRTLAFDPSAGTFYMMKSDGTAIYKWHPYGVRPAFDADTDGAAPDDPPSFTLPEWRAAAGEEVYVKAVIVALRQWNTGTGSNNTVTVTPSATGAFPSGATVNNSSGSWAELAASATTTGDLDRFTLTFPPLWGNGFLISVSSLRGVSIRSLTVVCEVRPMQGVA